VTTSVTSVNHVCSLTLNTSSVTALAFERDVQFDSRYLEETKSNFDFVDNE
jgi:hypothetical protein